MKKLVNKIKDTLSILSSSKGFTLLELLVVVLIIGILAGIALPQYEKSVEKTRLAEALLNISALQRGIDAYTLANGYASNTVYFLNDDPDVVLDIDITKNLDCETTHCANEFFSYTAACDHIGRECYIIVERQDSAEYALHLNKEEGNESWTKRCDYIDKYEWLCKYLESQGFDREEC